MRTLNRLLLPFLLAFGGALFSPYKVQAETHVQINLPQEWIEVFPEKTEENLKQLQEPFRSYVIEMVNEVRSFPDSGIVFVVPAKSLVASFQTVPIKYPILRDLNEGLLHLLTASQELNARRTMPGARWSLKEKGFTILSGRKAIRVFGEVISRKGSRISMLYYLVSGKDRMVYILLVGFAKSFPRLKASLEDMIRSSTQIIDKAESQTSVGVQ